MEGPEDHFGVLPHAVLGSSFLSSAINSHIISRVGSPRSAPPSESKSTDDLCGLQPGLPLPTRNKRPVWDVLEVSRAPPHPERLLRLTPWANGMVRGGSPAGHQCSPQTTPIPPPPRHCLHVSHPMQECQAPGSGLVLLQKRHGTCCPHPACFSALELSANSSMFWRVMNTHLLCLGKMQQRRLEIKPQPLAEKLSLPNQRRSRGQEASRG